MLRIARFSVKLAARPSSYAANHLSLPATQPRRSYSEEVVGVVSAVQHSLIAVHNITSLPWWGTFAVSTIGLRIGLLPLLRYQVLTSRKFAAAMPDITTLHHFFIQRMKELPRNQVNERMQVIGTFFKGVKASLEVNDVSVTQILAYPVINAAIFITFIYSVRDLILTGPESLDLDHGGALWFNDLFMKDRTFVLPLSAVTLSYTALELGLQAKAGTFFYKLKDFFQSILLLSIPMLTGLPSGVFCYWIPNSLYSMTQSQLMKSPQFLENVLRLPPIPNSLNKSKNSTETNKNNSVDNNNEEAVKPLN